MVSVDDKALLFRNRDMMWLEESGSPSIGDKGFLVRTEDGNFFLKGTSVSVGNKGRLFNINGVNYLRSKVTPPGTLEWSYNTGRGIYSRGAVDDSGNIYWGTRYYWGANHSKSVITSLTSEGDVNWSTLHDYETFYDTIQLSQDKTKLITMSVDYVLSLNVNDGSLNWNYSYPWACSAGFYSDHKMDSNDNVYIADDGGCGLSKLDIHGNLQWQNSSYGNADSEMAISSDNAYLYLHSWGSNMSVRGLAKIDSYSGEPFWANEDAGSDYTTIILDEGKGVLYSALNYDWIGEVELGDGTINWSVYIGPNYVGPGIQLSNDDLVYAYEWGDTSYLFSITPDGNMNWTLPTNGWIGGFAYEGGGLVADSDDMIYFGTAYEATNTFYSVTKDGEWGDIAYSISAADGATGNPILSPNENAVYFGTSDGHIISLDT